MKEDDGGVAFVKERAEEINKQPNFMKRVRK